MQLVSEVEKRYSSITFYEVQLYCSPKHFDGVSIDYEPQVCVFDHSFSVIYKTNGSDGLFLVLYDHFMVEQMGAKEIIPSALKFKAFCMKNSFVVL